MPTRNREYFGTPDRPGQIYQTSQYGIDFWTSLGVLKADITPADVIGTTSGSNSSAEERHQDDERSISPASSLHCW